MQAEAGRSAPRWFGPLVATATLIAVFGVAEVAARLVSYLTPAPRVRELPDAWVGLPVLDGLSDVYKPNARGLHNGVLYETNSLGLRGPERELGRAAGVFRIAVIGDSITAGSGVLYEDSYPALLESQFDARERVSPGRSLEVLNGGQPGLTAPLVIRRLEAAGLRYEPDLIVYGYTLNDIEGDAYRRSLTSAFAGPEHFAESPLHLVRLLGPRWNALLALAGARGSYEFELDDNYFDNPAAFAAVTRSFDRLAKIRDARRVCVVLLLHTKLHQLGRLHPFDAQYALVAAAARERGFHVIESFAYFKGMKDSSLWVRPDDPHPNPRGHQIFYRALADGLRELPESCWRQERP